LRERFRFQTDFQTVAILGFSLHTSMQNNLLAIGFIMDGSAALVPEQPQSGARSVAHGASRG
jgi:hypothetical protein